MSDIIHLVLTMQYRLIIVSCRTMFFIVVQNLTILAEIYELIVKKKLISLFRLV